MPLSSIDVVIVPGVGFDLAGRRLGYGAGYYDRTLAAYQGQRIGLAYELQVVPRLPEAPHDLRIDQLVTESRCITPRIEASEAPCPS